MEQKLEQFTEDVIRPVLHKDRGDVKLLRVENGVLWVKLLGQCANCGSAPVTLKEFMEKEITAAFPEIKAVELDDSPDPELQELARKILHHEIKL